MDKNSHWLECETCNNKTQLENHIAGANATETTPQTCTVCGYIIATPIGHTHNPTPVAAKSATCTEDGNLLYYVCSCGKWFLDSNATNEIIDHTSIVTKATGHTYSTDWTYNSTYHWHSSTCEHSAERGDVSEHTFVNNICSVCTYTKPTTPIAISEVYLNKSSINLDINESETLVETIIPTNATETINWISTAPSIATVNNGKVTGISNGSAVIIAISPSGITATCEVTVAENTNGFTFEEFGEGYAVVNYTGKETSLAIPSTYNGKPVISIGRIYGYPIGEGLINSSNIKNVTLPNTLKYIGVLSFANCTSLQTINIPNNVVAIYQAAFSGCTSLSSITIGSGINTIPDKCFYNCKTLTAVSLPDTIESIGQQAFQNCVSLKTLDLGNKLESIGEQAFFGCEKLESIDIPSSIKYFDFFPRLFEKCNSLKKLTVPSLSCELTALFYENAIPSSLIELIVLGGNTIKEGALSGCGSLEKLTLPFIGANASETTASPSTLFGYVFGKTSYTGSATTRQRYVLGDTYTTYHIPTSLKHVSILGGVIFFGAFINCVNLESISISNNVTSIGDDAFELCKSLTSVSFEDNSQLTSIGNLTFYNCSSLSNMVIPSSVTGIGEYAFSGCSSLTIYCEASSTPSEWSSNWNPDNRLVVWNYK